DSTRVYRIRDADLDRGSVHISLHDGTIAFTEETDGHVTGAIFRGDGEILLIPPNTVERGSLAFFTQAAILEESFSFAYFRFHDDVLNELRHAFRPADDPAALVTELNKVAPDFAASDALRL